MQLDYVRSAIERMRTQVHRQRGEIRQLQRAGISTTSAEALLERMLNKIDGLCAERDKLKKKSAWANQRQSSGAELKRFDHTADFSRREECGAPLATRLSVFRAAMLAAVKWTVGPRALDIRVVILPHGRCV
jgi:hypothetical protein